jgi:hypothetical protein
MGADDKHPQRMVRFQPSRTKPHGPILWGEPTDPAVDIGAALAKSPPPVIEMRVWDYLYSGPEEAVATDRLEPLGRILSPLERAPEGNQRGGKRGVSPCHSHVSFVDTIRDMYSDECPTEAAGRGTEIVETSD